MNQFQRKGARPDFQLWLDSDFNHHYESRADAEQHLRNLGRQFIYEANTAVQRNHLEEADRLASAAISADPKCMESLVLKAAIRRKENDPEGESLMAGLAEHTLNRGMFNMLVDIYSLAIIAKRLPSPKFRRCTKWNAHAEGGQRRQKLSRERRRDPMPIPGHHSKLPQVLRKPALVIVLPLPA